jgi:hypothetical protein
MAVARNTANAVIVVIFCDGGDKYLSERFWDEGHEHPALEGPRSSSPSAPADAAGSRPAAR